MDNRAPPHPLDDEEIVVYVTLTHVPTGAKAVVEVAAPCDSPPTVSEAIAQAGEEAKDLLLKELENH